MNDLFKCINCKEKFEHKDSSEYDIAYCSFCYNQKETK